MQGDSSLHDPDIPVVPPGEDELPSDDGEEMETNEHRLQMVLLIQSLKEASGASLPTPQERADEEHRRAEALEARVRELEEKARSRT